MKTLLRISILLNVTSLGFLTVILVNHCQETPAKAATASESAIVSRQSPQVAPLFHWTQLECTNDYATYVANLRAIGCPESTLHAIVSADFEAACNHERQRLEFVGDTTDRFSPETAKRAVADVLGEAPAPGPEGKADVQAPAKFQLQRSGVRVAGQTTARASYPLAFQHAVLNDSGLTQNQKVAVRQLQLQFVDAIGGPNQNANDPVYGARWQSAQSDADDTLRAKLGDEAYNTYKLQQYYSNFKQVMLNAGDGPVTIDPDALAK
jgi:hypothetical protein